MSEIKILMHKLDGAEWVPMTVEDFSGVNISDYSDVSALSGYPSAFPPVIGSGATEAVAGNDSRLTDARTPTAHTHVSADITDATIDGTPNTIVKRDEYGAISNSITDEEMLYGAGSFHNTFGYGLVGSSATSVGGRFLSDNSTALEAYTGTGTYHAYFGFPGGNNTFAVERIRGSLTWLYSGYSGKLKTSDITANREWTLPNSSGTVALTSDLASYAPLDSPSFNGTVYAPYLILSGSLSSPTVYAGDPFTTGTVQIFSGGVKATINNANGSDRSFSLPSSEGATLATIDGSETLTNKTFVAPVLGTPASGVATNLTGTAAGLTAGTVSSIGNLTGVVTSTNRVTAIADGALSMEKTSGLLVALGDKATVSGPNFFVGDQEIGGYLNIVGALDVSGNATMYGDLAVNGGRVITSESIETPYSHGTVTTSVALTSSSLQTLTLTASTACTVTMPTAEDGLSILLRVKQASSTGLGAATFTGVDWGDSGAPTITAAAGKMDLLSFHSDGTKWYGTTATGFSY